MHIHIARIREKLLSIHVEEFSSFFAAREIVEESLTASETISSAVESQ